MAERVGTMSPAESSSATYIERQTSKLPSDLFLWLAVGSIGGALTLRVMGRGEGANFIGQWAPTFLILGLYNKLVKIAGHGRYSEAY